MAKPSLSMESVSTLVEFIRFSLKEGLSVEQIKKTLLESGESENRVLVAMSYALSPEKLPQGSRPKAPEKGVNARNPGEEPSSPELCLEDFATRSSIEVSLPGVDIDPVAAKSQSAPKRKKPAFLVEQKVELMPSPERHSRPSIDQLREEELIRLLKKRVRERNEGKRHRVEFVRIGSGGLAFLGIVVAALWYFLFRK